MLLVRSHMGDKLMPDSGRQQAYHLVCEGRERGSGCVDVSAQRTRARLHTRLTYQASLRADMDTIGLHWYAGTAYNREVRLQIACYTLLNSR